MGKQYTPSKEKPWFCFNGDEFEYFATEDLAIEESKRQIADCLDESWCESVNNIMVGKVTQVSTQVNYQERPENIDEEGMAEDGEYWLDEWEYKCEYEPLPLKKDK